MSDDYAFYNEGEVGRLGRLISPARRVLRRTLRPYFYRLAALLRALSDKVDGLGARLDQGRAELARLDARQDDLDGRVREVAAFGWDHVALVRRLAALEDRMEAMTRKLEASRRSDELRSRAG